MSSSAGEQTPLAPPKRLFGLWSCVALVVANMIGSGVFVSSGFAMAGLQNRTYIMLAWVVGGAIAMCGAIAYGGLVKHISESGGEYLFLSRTVHPLAGFLAGWVSLVAGFTGAIAFAAFGFAEYATPPSQTIAIAITPSTTATTSTPATDSSEASDGVVPFAGVMRDDQGQPVSDATITVTDSNGDAHTLETDANGSFETQAGRSLLIDANQGSLQSPLARYTELIAALVVVIFGLLHLVKKPGIVFQNVIVAGKVLVIIGFLVFAGAHAADWPGRQAGIALNAGFNLQEFATTVMWISLAYSGFNAAVYITSEVEDAPRTVPRSMWLATLLVTVLYLLLNWVFVFGPTPEAVSADMGHVAAVAANAVGGSQLALVMRITICLALASSVSSMVIAGPRVYARMADDGVFPPMFKFGSENPRAAILLQVGLAVLVVLVSTLKGLMDYLSIVLSLSTAATVFSLFVLRSRDKQKSSAGILAAAGTFVLITLVLAAIRCTTLDAAWIVGASVATLVSGTIAYLIFAGANHKPTPAE